MSKKWTKSKLRRKLYVWFVWSIWSRALRYELARLRFPQFPKRPVCLQCGRRLLPWAALDEGWYLAWSCSGVEHGHCNNDEVWEPGISYPFGARKVYGRSFTRMGFDVN